MRLVQVIGPQGRRVMLVREPELLTVGGFASIVELAAAALREGRALTAWIEQLLTGERLRYDEVYAGRSEWRLLPPIDVPGDPHRVLVSGTGLTHYGSARERQAMHAAPQAAAEAAMTDSMRMFAWGQQQGRPAAGEVGVAPEWFYKGCGAMLRAHGEALLVPGYAEDGGEEAEVAMVYVNDEAGVPHRLGMCQGNEFSDHVFERRNYLNLAGSKLRSCALGPELVLQAPFDDIAGEVRILRAGKEIWQRQIRTGEANMCHSLANLEHHHFKFENHRQPGQVHVHFMGADALSFGEGLRLQAEDEVTIHFAGLGRPLWNPITVARPLLQPVVVQGME
ncbi:MAG: GguC protein [Acidobacteriota bacterium]|nr:GguC protein [Acidobacteriota bacterium]